MTDPTSTVQSEVPDAVKPVLAAARGLLSRIGGVALLIGVEDYSRHDPERGKDLLAGRNDVLAYWKVCRRLGYTHFRLLTSPALEPADLIRAERELAPELHPGETEEQTERRVKEWLSSAGRDAGAPSVLLGEATSRELEESARWLARTLVFTVKLEWEQWRHREEWMALPGFMAYSGHGARKDGELVLCPSDTGPALEDTVSFSELRAIFDEGEDLPGGKRPADNLTVVLDCCFAAAGGPAGKAQRGTSLTPAGAPARAPARTTEIARSVFCASGRDEPCYQAMLGGHWHGAFTWALTVALEQWEVQQEGQFRRSTMSHAELLFRARALLSALSFRQHPILVDELGNLPVFHHGAADGAATSAEPDARRPGGQLDPSSGKDYAWYQLMVGSQVLVDVIATRTSNSKFGFGALKEYWRINTKREQVPHEWGAWNGTAYCTDAFGGTIFTKQTANWPTDSGGLPFKESEKSFALDVDVPADGWKSFNATDEAYHVFNKEYGLRLNVWRSGETWAGQVEFVRKDTGTGLLFTGDKANQWALTSWTGLGSMQRALTTLT